MSEFFENYSLKKNNTFGLDVSCKGFYSATSVSDLKYFCKTELINNKKFFILGEGSNVLFRQNYPGIVIHPFIKGIEKLKDSQAKIDLKVGAGENWDDFVSYCVQNNWYGLENLSLIPGSVGSSPVQNIGAYGVEVKDHIKHVEGFFIDSGENEIFSNEECRFSYRSSIFKQDLKNRFVITSVVFSLSKTESFELGYGPVENEFKKRPVQNLENLRQTIIDIRQSKLPDPSVIGNAGSFFKNPVISGALMNKIKNNYPTLPSYPAIDGEFKIPAAWLIEQAGWKGVREGNTGTYPTQPLVIVNYGGASGEEIHSFASKIKNSVQEKFGISLEMEVNLV